MYFITLTSVYGQEIVVNMSLVRYIDTGKHDGALCSILMYASDDAVYVKESANQILQALPPGFA